MRIGIIGAGIFGLAAALELRQRGHEIIVYEQGTVPNERAAFVDSGRNDPQFPTRDARAAVRQLRPIYELYDKPRATLGIQIHDGAHEISGQHSIPWMLKQLKDTP